MQRDATRPKLRRARRYLCLALLSVCVIPVAGLTSGAKGAASLPLSPVVLASPSRLCGGKPKVLAVATHWRSRALKKHPQSGSNGPTEAAHRAKPNAGVTLGFPPAFRLLLTWVTLLTSLILAWRNYRERERTPSPTKLPVRARGYEPRAVFLAAPEEVDPATWTSVGAPPSPPGTDAPLAAHKAQVPEHQESGVSSDSPTTKSAKRGFGELFHTITMALSAKGTPPTQVIRLSAQAQRDAAKKHAAVDGVEAGHLGDLLGEHFLPLAGETVRFTATFALPFRRFGIVGVTSRRLLTVGTQQGLGRLYSGRGGAVRREQFSLGQIVAYDRTRLGRPSLLFTAALLSLVFPVGTVLAALCLVVYVALPRAELAVWVQGQRQLYPLTQADQDAVLRHLYQLIELGEGLSESQLSRPETNGKGPNGAYTGGGASRENTGSHNARETG